ncbi:MAG: hypothetical protein Q8M76_13345, partial [Spirochaetaceae bacterium]|nr:hypothetical protein [Spirochaetaceae bacterium]
MTRVDVDRIEELIASSKSDGSLPYSVASIAERARAGDASLPELLFLIAAGKYAPIDMDIARGALALAAKAAGLEYAASLYLINLVDQGYGSNIGYRLPSLEERGIATVAQFIARWLEVQLYLAEGRDAELWIDRLVGDEEYDWALMTLELSLKNGLVNNSYARMMRAGIGRLAAARAEALAKAEAELAAAEARAKAEAEKIAAEAAARVEAEKIAAESAAAQAAAVAEAERVVALAAAKAEADKAAAEALARAEAAMAAKKPGAILVETIPSDCVIALNEDVIAYSPFTFEGLDAGTYSLTIFETEFEDRTYEGERVELIVEAGKTTHLVRGLKPVPTTVYVDSWPKGAIVLVGGKEVGTTP